MADTTTTLGLEKVSTANTLPEWCDMFNNNLDVLDGFPLPIEYGKNDTMEYVKFSNGKVIMFGRVNHGKNYPCTTAWAASAGYASKDFTLDFPIALVNSNPVIVSHCIADVNPDTWVLTRSTSYTQYKGCYLCAISETSNTKILNMLIMGDWK